MTQPPSNNSLVSVRMPKSMFDELKGLAEKNHFLDVSEQVRSIARNRWLESKDPRAYHLKRLRNEIADALKSRSEERTHEQLIRELERIKDSLLKESPQGGQR